MFVDGAFCTRTMGPGNTLAPVLRTQFTTFTYDRRGRFADKMNGIPKYVASTTRTQADWKNPTIITGDLIDEVRQIVGKGDGMLLVVGSGSIVRQLVSNDLVDEIRLMVFPTALGTGTRTPSLYTRTVRRAHCW